MFRENLQAFQENTASNSWEKPRSESMMITENPRIRERSQLSEIPDKVEVEIGQVKLRQILQLNTVPRHWRIPRRHPVASGIFWSEAVSQERDFNEISVSKRPIGKEYLD